VIQNWSHVLSAPAALGRGRQSPDQARDMAAELAGWNSGELAGQVPGKLALMAAGRALGRGPAVGQRVTPPRRSRTQPTHLISGFTAAS